MKMRRVVSLLLTVYISLPVTVYLFPWVLGHIIYSHLLRLPLFVDLDRPEDVLNHTRNFYLPTEKNVSVGVWHTLPLGQWEKAAEQSAEWHQDTLRDGRTIIVYLHGNLGTRAIRHRVELVKVLSGADFHVLSLDYRGFGDSSGEPSEAGLTTDALYLYQWVKQQSGGSLVCLWGHSLGTGVATNTAVRMKQQQESAVDALILEAPYTRMGDVIINHPVARLYSFLPGIESLIWSVLKKNAITFPNDANLQMSSSPVLILHAEDDYVVPHYMGLKLFDVLQLAGVHVEMKLYGGELGYSHNYMYLDPNLPHLLRRFLENSGL